MTYPTDGAPTDGAPSAFGIIKQSEYLGLRGIPLRRWRLNPVYTLNLHDFTTKICTILCFSPQANAEGAPSVCSILRVLRDLRGEGLRGSLTNRDLLFEILPSSGILFSLLIDRKYDTPADP